MSTGPDTDRVLRLVAINLNLANQSESLHGYALLAKEAAEAALAGQPLPPLTKPHPDTLLLDKLEHLVWSNRTTDGLTLGCWHILIGHLDRLQMGGRL